MSMGIEERWHVVQEQIAVACRACGRDPASVQLVAVSKTYPPEAVDVLARLGCRIFGESRVQEAQQKIPACSSGLEWHGIGHLQRNKVAQAVALFSRLHGVDSLPLLEKIEACAAEAGRRIRVCLEVNVSGESSKFGFAPEAMPATLAVLPRLQYAVVDGLMTIPPFREDPEESRLHFRRLRTLRDAWAGDTGYVLEELSMGMSHDMAIAIEEGATIVRVGTALFGARPKPGGEI